MQFSEHWLRTFVDPAADSEQLSHLLTMAGLEVEERKPAAPAFSGVVVASIVETAAHPNADKLKLCKVDAGTGELLQIVCGAPNAAAGMKVPCAMIGAILPGGFAIKAAKLRGIESAGMLCSARELGLSEDHSGLLPLPEDAPVGQDVRDYLHLDDTVIEIKLTPNRGDCLSLTGVAREVAAITGAALKEVDIVPVAPATGMRREIVLDAPQACPRYCGRIVRGVDARSPTPEWMKRRLARSGIRAISALVDITNYVMLELGQPLHAFDDTKLQGAIHVRFPREGEEVTLLNGQKVHPESDTLLIADESRALALAGVMGGEETGITLDTRDLFLESAFFMPIAIAGRARKYGFSTDASYRYERGVDFELAPRALERATQLVVDICGGQAGPLVEAVSANDLPARLPVTLRPQRVRRLLGFDVDDAVIRALLERDGLKVEGCADDALRVTPPSFRFDIEIEEDLVEEIVRLYGYDNIPVKEPGGTLMMLPDSETQRSPWRIRHLLAALGYQEVINYAFIDEEWERAIVGTEKPVRLANPIASQMNVMRSSLVPGLISNLIVNRNRRLNRVRFFEIGNCFVHSDQHEPVEGFYQPARLAALGAGGNLPEQWGSKERNVDFFDLKGDLEALFVPRVLEFRAVNKKGLHPGRAAAVYLQGREIGFIGELHPLLVQRFELGTPPVVFELELDAVTGSLQPSSREISRMPVVQRDLALVVDRQTSAATLLDLLKAHSSEIIRDIRLFDVYQGQGLPEGKKSLAFRLLMQDTSKTLEDADVDAAVSELVRHAEKTVGARLRGSGE